jgi:hypothetical protein
MSTSISAARGGRLDRRRRVVPVGVRWCGSSYDRSPATYRRSCSRGSAEHPDRFTYRVLAFVANEGGHINSNLRVVGYTQASGGESQNIRDARSTFKQHAHGDGLASWRVIDHVAPGQNRQSRGLGVARHRRFKRLHPEEPIRLASRRGLTHRRPTACWCMWSETHNHRHPVISLMVQPAGGVALPLSPDRPGSRPPSSALHCPGAPSR